MENTFLAVLNDIASKVPGKEKHEGDYIGKDGILYCGVCDTKKQTRISVMQKEMTVPVMCRCEQERHDTEIAEKKEAEKLRVISKLRRECFLTDEMAGQTFAVDDQHDSRISAAMRRYAERWDEVKVENMGLLLYGQVGTGKSFFAACIANALIDKGIPVKMTSFSRIVNEIQGLYTGRQEYLDKLTSYPLLIIDDLGAERGSDFMLEQVYAVVDARYQSGLPLIVTTNIPVGEIKEPADLKYRRIYDRILERCHPVKIDGPSRRREALKENFAKRAALLGL